MAGGCIAPGVRSAVSLSACRQRRALAVLRFPMVPLVQTRASPYTRAVCWSRWGSWLSVSGRPGLMAGAGRGTFWGLDDALRGCPAARAGAGRLPPEPGPERCRGGALRAARTRGPGVHVPAGAGGASGLAGRRGLARRGGGSPGRVTRVSRRRSRCGTASGAGMVVVAGHWSLSPDCSCPGGAGCYAPRTARASGRIGLRPDARAWRAGCRSGWFAVSPVR